MNLLATQLFVTLKIKNFFSFSIRVHVHHKFLPKWFDNIPFLWLLLHFKHLWWLNVRWKFVLLSYIWSTLLILMCSADKPYMLVRTVYIFGCLLSRGSVNSSTALCSPHAQFFGYLTISAKSALRKWALLDVLKG